MTTELLKPTESGTPLRIVFFPSSYYTSSGGPGLADFNTRVDTMWKSFEAHVFFRRYLGRIGAWRLDATTTKDVHPDPGQRSIASNGPEVLNWTKKHVPAFDAANNDVVVFCIGPNRYGKGEWRKPDQPMNEVTIGRGSENSIVHEFGHAFGRLGDEYSPQKTPPAAPPEYPNIALPTVPGFTCTDKWGDLIGLQMHPHPDVPSMKAYFGGWNPVGCELIRGGRPSNHYRPCYDSRCLMYVCGSEHSFCPVCHRALERLMHRYGTGETRVTFDRLPDGHVIDKPLAMKGNEFLAYGVWFEPDPVHYARRLRTQPAVVADAYGSQGNALVMVEEGNLQQHVSRNIHMRFDWLLEEVMIEFHGADSVYELIAFDEDGTELAKSEQQANLHGGPHTIAVRDPRRRIRKVEFGEEQSVTVVTELRYR